MKKLMIFGCLVALLGAGINSFADPAIKKGKETPKKSMKGPSKKGQSPQRSLRGARYLEMVRQHRSTSAFKPKLQRFISREELSKYTGSKSTTHELAALKSRQHPLGVKSFPPEGDVFSLSYRKKINSILNSSKSLTTEEATQIARSQWNAKYQSHYTDATAFAHDLFEYYEGIGTSAITTMLPGKKYREIIVFEIPVEGITFAPKQGTGMIRLRPMKKGNTAVGLKSDKWLVIYDKTTKEGWVVERDGFILSKIVTQETLLKEQQARIQAESAKAASADPISTYHAHQQENLRDLVNAEIVWESGDLPHEFSTLSQLGRFIHNFHKNDIQHVHLTDAKTGEVFRVYEIVNANLSTPGLKLDPHTMVLLYNEKTGKTKMTLRSNVEAALSYNKSDPLANYIQHKEKTLAKMNEVEQFWKQNNLRVSFENFTDLGLYLEIFHRDDPTKVKVYNTFTGRTNYVYEIVVPNLRLQDKALFDPQTMIMLYDMKTHEFDMVLRSDIENGTFYKLVE